MGPTVQASATLRDVLAELLWSGATAAQVMGADGSRARPSRPGIDSLARGRQAS